MEPGCQFSISLFFIFGVIIFLFAGFIVITIRAINKSKAKDMENRAFYMENILNQDNAEPGMPEVQENKLSLYEGVPLRNINPYEEKGIEIVKHFELGTDNLIISKAGGTVEIPYGSISSISVYREEHKEKYKIKVNNPRARDDTEMTSHNEIYVCLIQTYRGNYKMKEGVFDFHKSLGKKVRPTFRENLMLFLEKLRQVSPDTKLDKGAINLLKKVSQLPEDPYN